MSMGAWMRHIGRQSFPRHNLNMGNQPACSNGARACTRLSFRFTLAVCVIAFSAGISADAQVTYSDSFNTNVNYLTNGISGTIWDGVYLGAGEFSNSGVGGGGPGATVQADANISTPNTLTLQTTGTAWENADDDGFFLFKVVPGDFSATVHVVSPYNNSGYNTAGLQVRAFDPGGDPLGGSEDYVSWTRFDQFNYANYLRNEVNGGVTPINPGGFPNTNYWLRIDRVRGTNFSFYQKSTQAGAWSLVTFPAPVSGTILRRADFAGRTLQVGIMHSTFNGQIGVKFTDFSLTESNSTVVAAPSAPPWVIAAPNANLGMDISWNSGAGSSGSVVVVWPATNSTVKEMPANGYTYTGNSLYGVGDVLPAAGYYVVSSGTATNVSVAGLAANTTYNVAVYSYAGSGSSITYNHSPVVSSVLIALNQVVAQLDVQANSAAISFSANPGKWYWLQYSDSLSPANWQNLLPDPVLAYSPAMSIQNIPLSSAPTRFYRLQEVDSDFSTKLTSGAITSLRRSADAEVTEYISGGKLGNARINYQPAGGATWYPVNTATPSGVASATYFSTTNASGTQYTSRYIVTNGLSGTLVFESVIFMNLDTVRWSLNFTNLTGQSVTVGDLALPLPMNTAYSGVSSSAMKHSFISGNGSFVFWMRPDSVGPCLLMTPNDDTKLEFWDVRAPGYEVFVHSYVAGTNAAAQYPTVITQGDRWRQPNTSLTLAPGASQSYGVKFQWANDYDAIRQALVDEGKVDVHIVPGMTVPTNLFAQIALRTTQTVSSVTSEFPAQTQLQFLGTTNVSANTYQLYQVQFERLGENKLTITYGNNRTMYLEFFVTEPLETLVKKRAAYLVSHQIITNKWYSGLFCDYNMNDGKLITPDNHDTLSNSFQVYEIASDDAGESRPAYLAEKEAVFPVQSEVTALDYYITNFVWGGLQRTTNETSSYGIYGVPDWQTLRTNGSSLGGDLGRGYDYPHIIAMYCGMYRVAKFHPEVTTVLSAQEYLQRAWGTAMAMWSFGGGQATQIGLMNEVVIPNLLADLDAEGMTTQAASLRTKWETKVVYYISGSANLFGSEYAFDATGFESQEAYAKYALQHAGSSAAMGSANVPLFLSQANNFMRTQIGANIFDRGWLETAYYYYGSDYRGNMGNDFVVTYMAQMGGWGLLDYALNYATNATDYLRLGYGSYLNGWSTMNTGTPDSNYGFWYPGVQNDGGCGGGFEPSPYNLTWLNNQPMHRGPWYYSAEQNLGFCGAIRSAATILADDPIFGRFCYGGIWTNDAGAIKITPLDGVRVRFHAMLTDGAVHLVLDSDHFTTGQSTSLAPNLTQITFAMETGNTASHTTPLHFSTSLAGTYNLSDQSGTITTFSAVAGQEIVLNLPFAAGGAGKTFSITKQ
jgi:hypothetical protein